MKRYIKSAIEKAKAYDFYYNPDIRKKMFAASNKAKTIQRETGAFAVCYAVAYDRNGANELEYDSDGCLFSADSYEEYRQQVESYCNGQDENLFEFYTVRDESQQSFEDEIENKRQEIFNMLDSIADQYPGLYLASKGRDKNMLSISNYKYQDNYNSNHNTIFIWITPNISTPIIFDEGNRSRREKKVLVRPDCSDSDLDQLYAFVSRWAKRNQ